MFGIRVARQLELPSDEMVTLLMLMEHRQHSKKLWPVKALRNYRSSDGSYG
jgi:hypothetical protein